MAQHYYSYYLGREDIDLEPESECGSGKWEGPRRLERRDCGLEQGDSEVQAALEVLPEASEASDQRDATNCCFSRAEDELHWASTLAALTGDIATPGSGSGARGQEFLGWPCALAQPGTASAWPPGSTSPPAPQPQACPRRHKAHRFRFRRTDDRFLSVRKGLQAIRLLILKHYQEPFPLTNNDFLRIQEYRDADMRGRSPVRKPAEWYMYGLEAAEWRDQAISSEIEKTVMNSLLRYWGWGGDDVQTNDEFAGTVKGLFRLQGGSRCANGCGGRDSPRPKSGYSASSESLGGKEGDFTGGGTARAAMVMMAMMVTVMAMVAVMMVMAMDEAGRFDGAQPATNATPAAQRRQTGSVPLRGTAAASPGEERKEKGPALAFIDATKLTTTLALCRLTETRPAGAMPMRKTEGSAAAKYSDVYEGGDGEADMFSNIPPINRKPLLGG